MKVVCSSLSNTCKAIKASFTTCLNISILVVMVRMFDRRPAAIKHLFGYDITLFFIPDDAETEDQHSAPVAAVLDAKYFERPVRWQL